MPVEGVIYALDQMDALMELRKNPKEKHGLSTGFTSLDELMLISLGYLSIITGIPSSGKSEVMDGVAVNMAHIHDWNFVFYSPENYPIHEHVKKLIEKYHGKPLRAMTREEIEKGVRWVHKHFAWLYPPEDKAMLKDLLVLTDEVRALRKISGLVIDPWNEVSHAGQGQLRDDQYISRQLSTLRRYNRENSIHTFVIAHPVKMVKDANGNYPVPTTYDISGGAMWRNKADYAWCVHRPDPHKNEVDIHVQKIKYKYMGRVGAVTLDYEYQSGRLKDQDAPNFAMPGEQPPY
jgi:twinkle protein